MDCLQNIWVWKRHTRKGTKLPLILYLHGASGRGDSWEHLESGLPKLLNCEQVSRLLAGEDVVVVAPQCPAGTEWAKAPTCAALRALLDHLLNDESDGAATGTATSTATTTAATATATATCTATATAAAAAAARSAGPIDPARVYCTGMSMGGLGCWELAARNPSRFAALLPVCGGGNPVYAPLLKDVPLLFAHAEDDKVVPIADTEALVAALERAGGNVARLRRWRSGVDALGAENESWCEGHNCWDEFYRDPDTWRWLFQQQRRESGSSSSSSSSSGGGGAPAGEINDDSDGSRALSAEEVAAAHAAGNKVVYSGGGDEFDPPHVRAYNRRMAELEKVESERGLLDGHELVERTVAAAEDLAAATPARLLWCALAAAAVAAIVAAFWQRAGAT